ncbi:MAG: DUF5050 domain-containing protein, partial [Nitrososphaerota archaeon]|nr:DUF5050 domain-containing protein [Nitrososphaerota archaeon]
MDGTWLMQRGNTTGNIVNGGYYAQQGDYIFFMNNSDSGKLYKVRVDGNDLTKLCDDPCKYVNVMGEYVYYSKGSRGSNGKLCKIKTDGSNRTQLNNDDSAYINVLDDWIYYCNESDNQKLYKMRINGENRQKLCDDKSISINVVDNWIYYSNRSDDYKIYKIAVDGKSKLKLNDDDCSFINVVNDWIYYINLKESGRVRFCDSDANGVIDEWAMITSTGVSFGAGMLYKMRIDGRERRKIYSSAVSYLNVVNGYVFFTETNESSSGKNSLCKLQTNGPFARCKHADANCPCYGNGLCKMRADGTDITCIGPDGSFINVVNDWLYYHVPSSMSLFREPHEFTKIGTNVKIDEECKSIDNSEKQDSIISKLERELAQEINRLPTLTGIFKRNDREKCISRIEQIKTELKTLNKADSDGVPINKKGNTNGNLVNNGFLSVQGDWVYYHNVSKLMLYKARLDGSEAQMLTDDPASFINVIGDWVYYNGVTYGGGNKLFRIRTDGTGRQKLMDDTCEYLLVAGEWAYYCSGNEGNNLYKVRIDGTGRQKLNNDHCGFLNLYADWLYYYNKNDHSTYKTDLSGKNNQKIASYSFTLNVMDDWIYFCD